MELPLIISLAGNAVLLAAAGTSYIRFRAEREANAGLEAENKSLAAHLTNASRSLAEKEADLDRVDGQRKRALAKAQERNAARNAEKLAARPVRAVSALPTTKTKSGAGAAAKKGR